MKKERILLLPLFLLGVTLSNLANGAQISGSQLNLFYGSHGTSIISRVLGQSCIVLDFKSSELPCQPAYMFGRKAPGFEAELFLGLNRKPVEHLGHLSEASYGQELLGNLLQGEPTLVGQVSTDVTYQMNRFGVSVDPYRLSYYSALRNEELPVLSLLATEDHSLRVQWGSGLQSGILIGIQFRALNRRLVAYDLTFYDLLDDTLKDFEISEQNLLFIEPGAVFQGDGSLKPQLSVMIANAGFADTRFGILDPSPVLEVGLGVAPNLPLGDLAFGIAYRGRYREEADSADRLRVGLSYSLHGLRSVLGLAERDVAMGILSHLGPLSLGFMVHSLWLKEYEEDDSDHQVISAEVGMVF